jgi:hypothetical protein
MVSDEKRRGALESLRDSIEESDSFSERDRDVLLAFDDKLALLRSEYGVHRHEKLLRHLWIVARDSDVSVADILDSRDAAVRTRSVASSLSMMCHIFSASSSDISTSGVSTLTATPPSIRGRVRRL